MWSTLLPLAFFEGYDHWPNIFSALNALAIASVGRVSFYIVTSGKQTAQGSASADLRYALTDKGRSA